MMETRELVSELPDQGALLEAAFRATPDLLAVKDRGLVYRGVNPAFCEFLGRPTHEILGKTDYDLFPADEAELYRRTDAAVLQSRKVYCEDEQVTGGRGLQWLNVYRTPVLDGSGQPIGVLCAVRNVTDRRRVRDVLATERDLARALSNAKNLGEVLDFSLDAALRISDLRSGGIWLIDVGGAADLGCYRGASKELARALAHFDAGAPIMHLLSAGLPIYCSAEELPDWMAAVCRHECLRSAALLPVFHGGEWLATLAVGSHTLDALPAWISTALEAIIVHLREALVRLRGQERCRKLERAIEQSSSTIVITDRHGAIEYVNPRFVETTGYTQEEALGQNPRILKSGEQPHEFYADLWRTISSGQDWRGEFHNRRKDGTLYWEAATISPITDAQGQITHYVAVKEDVTERKRAEVRGQLDRARLDAVLTLYHMADAPLPQITNVALEEAVRLTGSQIGYLAFLNEDESVLTMHAWSKTAMKQCAIADKPIVYHLQHTGLWGEAVRQRRPIITNDYAAPSPWKKGYPEGHVRVTRHMNVPIFDGQRIVAVAGVGNKEEPYDDSDVRQLTLLIQGMWRLIQQKRARDELEAFNIKAEAATRAKSEFLANMSHEIRTPMTAILGFTEVLLGEEDLQRAPPERVQALETIQRNGAYLLRLINDILDLSKIEAGKLEVERTPCSPAQVLADVASLMRVPAQAKNLPLEMEYVGPIPEHIQSDPTRLRQILINLVGNAIKFTETGCVRVVARLVRQSLSRSLSRTLSDESSSRSLSVPAHPDRHPQSPSMKIETKIEDRQSSGNDRDHLLQFDVIDTGIGMTTDQLDRIFQPFTQADASANRKSGGTGLGLTISKRLAEMLGGDIRVTSTPGKGSTFSVTVETGPLDGTALIEHPSESEIRIPSPTSTGAAADVRLAGRILLAEDGPDNQRLIAFLLRKAGADVTLAENGQVACDAAVAALESGRPFDVILMDMQMPVMDGYEATRRLRAEGYAGPIVALTAHAMEGAEEACRAAGCDGYLTKPLDRAKFLPAVAGFLPSGRLAPAIAPLAEVVAGAVDTSYV